MCPDYIVQVLVTVQWVVLRSMLYVSIKKVKYKSGFLCILHHLIPRTIMVMAGNPSNLSI